MAFQLSSQIKHKMLLLCLFAVLSSCASNLNSAEDNSLQSQTIIGIDLGTTYSCVGVFHQGRVEILANDQGNRITPSYVAFTPDGRRLIGDAAKNQATVNTENTIFDVKRFIGRGFNEKTVQDDRKMLPYELIDVDNKPYIQIRNSGSSETIKLAPEEVSAMILSKMKETAETFLGYPVHRAVVTVPAYFTDSQRHATRDAAVIAGLKVERILNEPTAAAIAFGMDKSNYSVAKEETTVLVFDLGGGTFDVTVLLVDNGAFQVLATNGDTHLGGEDFDQRVMEYVVQQIKGKDSIDISKNKRALQKLRKEVERAKRALSNQYKARLEVDDLVPGYHLSETLTRAKFEELNLELFKKTLGPVRKVLEDALLEISEIDEIVMVGGSTRIPKVQQLLFEFFDGKEPNTKMNPDEAVAYGAAIQGSILSGQGGDAVKSVVLVDVTPLSLGTETKGGVMDVLIPRGSVIPTEKTKSFFTIDDRQTSMTIDVYEGERSQTKYNHLLGLFELTDIPPAPRGDTEVRITYKVDVNGMLEVTASLVGGRNKKTVIIEPESGRLSQNDIDRMLKEAERFASEDKTTRERIESRNSLESLAYEITSQLDQIDSDGDESIAYLDAKKSLSEKIEETLLWLESNEEAEKDEVDSKYSELQAISNPVLHRYKNSEKRHTGETMDDEL